MSRRQGKRAAFAHRQRRDRRVARVYAAHRKTPGFVGVTYGLRIDGVPQGGGMGALFIVHGGRR